MSEKPPEAAEKTPVPSVTDDHLKVEDEGSDVDVDVRDFPQGPVRAWLTVLGSFLLQLGTVGPVMAFGVFQDFYTRFRLRNHSASTISWIGSTQIFLELFLGAIVGKLYDAGYRRSMLIAGVLLYCLCFFMLSLTQDRQYYQAFLSQGFGMGSGIALVYVPTCTLVAQHFKQRKALAMGLVTAAGPLGGIVYSIMLNRLLESSSDFGWGVRYAAFLTLGCACIGNLLLSFPDVPNVPLKWGRPAMPNRKSIDSPAYLLTLLAGFTAQLGTFFPVFYIQLFATQHGLPATLSFYSLAILNASSIIGRIIPGYLADKLGAGQVWIVCAFSTGIFSIMMLACAHRAALIIFCICYGFAVGATTSVYVPAAIQVAPSDANIGLIIGLALVPVGVASLIGPPVIGAILGSSMTWWRGITFVAIVLVSSSAMELIALGFNRYRRSRV